jgi:hypothetical protein
MACCFEQARLAAVRLDSYVNHHFLNGVYVDGGVKGFLIDHPVKGEKYHLLFSSVESPHADLTFRGVARLDHSGDAEVDIDEFYGLTKGNVQLSVPS